ncbi:hypothetical protein [Jeotgalibaca porci]|uniref:hypothetical protein n=1 Tax=Jeotgalibaca porci TaxID=1868793 RepID=UPI00359F8978
MTGKAKVKVIFKTRWRYKYMRFKIDFQSLFNPYLSYDTRIWLVDDIVEYPDKYIKTLVKKVE